MRLVLLFWSIAARDFFPPGNVRAALAIIVFCFFYTLFGCVLYVLGPLVLALIPVSGIGQLGKTYAINVMTWNAWGILYAVFGALITQQGKDRSGDNLAISVADPRKYRCWAGCTREMIRGALGRPVSIWRAG